MINEITINGIIYVPKSQTAANTAKMESVIIGSGSSAGCGSGEGRSDE